MKKYVSVPNLIKRPVFWVAVAIVAIAIGIGLYFMIKPRPHSEVLPVVGVEPVTTSEVNIYGEYVGRIRAQQFVEVRARVEGYLRVHAFCRRHIYKERADAFYH